jgi:hypothetical protein
MTFRLRTLLKLLSIVFAMTWMSLAVAQAGWE